MGSLSPDGFTEKLGRSLNYVECHDNYTLFDKLDISINNGTDSTGYVPYEELTSAQQSTIREENKLAAAFVFLAQGTPFINGGQEFMRTKQGNENSYKSDDDINAIDLSFKEQFSDVYNVYKGLIALRKQYDCFRGNYKKIDVNTPSTGVTKYTITTADDQTIVALFNAKSEDFVAKISEKFKTNDKQEVVRARTIDISTGSVIVGNEDLTSDTIPAKGFKIYNFYTE